MIKRLRLKFICVNMIIVVLMMLAIFALVFHFTQQDLFWQADQTMELLLENGRPGRIGEERRVKLPYFRVSISPGGMILGTAGNYFDLSDEQNLSELIEQAQTAEEDSGSLPEYGLRFRRRTDPFGQVIVFLDVSSHTAALAGLVKACSVIGLLSTGVFLGISYLLARWAIRPVEKAWNQQRQFIADASHELKTPLTVITTNAELLQSAQYTPEERQRFTASILTMAHQMRGLVEGLLELARVDNGAVKTAFVRLDLGEVAENALLPFEPVYFEQGLTLESHIESGLSVKGSLRHLHQVVDILLDNASKYSTPGGNVIISVHRQGNQCHLIVDSPGQTLTKEERKKIFTRFYRADPARKMEHSYGLGLAIAKGIVTDHGGKIWAESREGRNSFHILLPLV